jgi:Fe-S cluster assembly iron-binding protein IscA
MFTLTPTAALTLDELRRQQDLPAGYGVRVWARSEPDGDVTLQLTFAETPADDDIITEHHGTLVFIAQDVAEPLSDITLDATSPPSADGSSPPELLLRPQRPDED